MSIAPNIHRLCESCEKPLTAGYAKNKDWQKCLRCKIKEDGYEP